MAAAAAAATTPARVGVTGRPRRRRALLSRCAASSLGGGDAAAARYAALFSRASTGGCPALFLAPMEGLADRPFRRALAAVVGGFDEACTEFIRIPGAAPDTEAQLRRAAARLTEGAYDARELTSLPHGSPLAVQLMGSLPHFLAAATEHLVGTLGAHRVDLNCGCPGARPGWCEAVSAQHLHG